MSTLLFTRHARRRLTTTLVTAAALALTGCTNSTPSGTPPTESPTATATDEPSKPRFSVIEIPAGYGLKIFVRVNLQTGNWTDRVVAKSSASMSVKTGSITSGGEGIPLRDACKVGLFAKTWKLSGGRPRCLPLE